MDTKEAVECSEHKIIWETNYWWGCIIVKSKYIKEVREALNNGFKKHKSKYFENGLFKKDILSIYSEGGKL